MNFQGKLIARMRCIAAVACSPLAPRPNYSKFFILTPITGGASPAAVRMTAADFRRADRLSNNQAASL
jgi:hypothetical protein